jgi:multicomponent Na+:H+ antiporter subunit A
MLGALALVLAAAALLPLAYRRWPRVSAWATVGLAAALCAGFGARVPAIVDGGSFTESIRWAPGLGVTLALRLDGLASLMALIVTGIGALILAYSISYVGHGPRLARLLALLLLFLGAMLWLILADDAISMFVAWELTSVISFFLIAFDDSSRRNREAARQALVVTAAGGLALLVGLLLAAAATGAGGLSVGLAGLAGADLRSSDLYPAIVVLIAAGAFSKSAQLPFHFWLPGAMVAPTPVSAYLHSATLVQAGVYVLARVQPALGGTPLWTGLLVSVGALTMLVGALLAVFERDLKRILAYSTVSVLGALTLLLGIGTRDAIIAFAVVLLAHALYKAALFLVAGNVGHATGTRDVRALRGLGRAMPMTAATALVAAASMAGVPPLFGFVAKESLYLAAGSGVAAVAVGIAVVTAGALLVAAALRAGVAPFVGRAGPAALRDPPAAMRVGPAVLAAAGVLFGVAPGLLGELLIAPAAAAIAGAPVPTGLALWHGLAGVHGAVLALGLASTAGGLALHLVIARRPHGGALILAAAARLSAERGYAQTMVGLQRVAALTTAALQSGRLRRYVAITAVVSGALVALALSGEAVAGALVVDRAWGPEALLLGLAGAGAVLAAVTPDRLATVAALGATGLAIAALYALLSAPDLAITQLLVETLTVILLVLVFRKLPGRLAGGPRRVSVRLGNLLLAGGLGALVAVLLLVVVAPSPDDPAPSPHAREAPAQHARNVVNAILVNFRALDTLGEIIVLVVAGIGVFALLRLRPHRGESWSR